MPEELTRTFDDDFLTPEYFANPYPLYHRLRAEAPACWSEKLEAWLLTRYDDVKAGLNDPRLNSSGRIASILDRLPSGAHDEYQALLVHMNNMMSFNDPPVHTRLRSLIGKAFTPLGVTSLRPQIQVIVDELLDNVAGKGRFDLVDEFAFHLPAIVICDMLGVPREDRNKIRRWSDDIVGFVSAGAVTPKRTARAQKAVYDATDYLVALADERRRYPRDDMLTALVEAEDAGDTLSEDEFISMIVLLFFAGFETTEGLIGNGMLALFRNPEQRKFLREHPETMETAVEEFLRYDSSVQRQSRVANEIIKLHGEMILQGEYVVLLIGAANRDPEHFVDPDKLDITRAENKHIGFGHGIHSCIGGPLARIETQIAISTILRRMPHIRLVEDEPEFVDLFALRKLRALWVAPH
ncbi:MAG: cytochrome P450 [Anaerolineales bacterium]|jgi:cytochrome P450|nr:cytochrome P450 [Anaerolineales bacterium]|tara:strand:+ start:15683 stop:16912 length:1230 start_codon:yes stop_codon:yes gene_type:complete